MAGTIHTSRIGGGNVSEPTTAAGRRLLDEAPEWDHILKAAVCHCSRPGSGRCDCTEARVHAAELTALFNLRWKADRRATKRWQEAHPGNDLVWPDHADMVVWLLEQLDEAEARAEAMRP